MWLVVSGVLWCWSVSSSDACRGGCSCPVCGGLVPLPLPVWFPPRPAGIGAVRVVCGVRGVWCVCSCPPLAGAGGAAAWGWSHAGIRAYAVFGSPLGGEPAAKRPEGEKDLHTGEDPGAWARIREKPRHQVVSGLFLRVMRRCATLPHPVECSTIAVPGLSFRVRNGTGRLTWAMTAANLQFSVRERERAVPAGLVVVREPDSGREFHDLCLTASEPSVPCHQSFPAVKTHRTPARGVCVIAFRPLVPVSSTPRGASTSGLSTTCSAWGLQALEGATES